MIKNKLSIKFYSEPIYEQKYMPKENMHFTCIACITIDSVMRIDKKKPSTGVRFRKRRGKI